MDLADILKIALAIIGVLVLIFCGAVWRELESLRKSRHAHANWLTQLTMATNEVIRKVGLPFEVKGPPQ